MNKTWYAPQRLIASAACAYLMSVALIALYAAEAKEGAYGFFPRDGYILVSRPTAQSWFAELACAIGLFLAMGSTACGIYAWAKERASPITLSALLCLLTALAAILIPFSLMCETPRWFSDDFGIFAALLAAIIFHRLWKTRDRQVPVARVL